MTDTAPPALLPTGLHDVLPPEAEREARIVETLTRRFATHGFDRVKPPMVEFEDSLLSGPGAAMGSQIFRMMDPISQRMMGVRADMTLQVARIAATRLRREPRPLRLSYTGEVLRVRGTQLRPERQFRQVGSELIGSLAPAADAEVIALAAEGLSGIGLERLSVDLTLPTLVPALCDAAGLDPMARAALFQGIERRDPEEVEAVDTVVGPRVAELIRAAGPAEEAVARLKAMDLPSDADADRQRLVAVVALLRERDPELAMTVDPVERRGFEFQTGLSFTLFARGARGEIGRGGRYRAGGSADGPGEPSCGVTIFMDTVIRAVAAESPVPRVFVPVGTGRDVGERLRSEGWITIAGLDGVDDPRAEARRLGCGHVVIDGAPVAV